MTTRPESNLVALLRIYAGAAGAATAGGGFLVLFGWAFDITVLKKVLPDLVAMKANSAVAFLLSGFSLWLLQAKRSSRHRKYIVRTCASMVALIGLLTFTQYLFGWDLHIDQLLFVEPETAVGTSSPGRMALTSTLNHLLLGIALLLLDSRHTSVAQTLALAASLIAMLSLVGYAYDIELFYSVAAYTQMAAHAAAVFLILGVGALFARADRGLMEFITGDDAGGAMARRLLPAAVGLPLVIGWIDLMAARRELYGLRLAIALFAVSSVIVFSTLIWLNARSLFRVSIKHRQAEQMFRNVLESAPDAMVIINERGEIVLVNSQAERLFDYRREEMIGQKVETLMPEQHRNSHAEHREGYIARPETRAMGPGLELHGQRKHGSLFPVEVALSPLMTKEGMLVTAAIRDITERKQAEEALARQAEELARSNSELAQFAYVASHDLQEPLRAVAGCVQLLRLRLEDNLDPRSQELISHTVDGATRMQTLIDDLLTLSRVSTRSKPLEPVDCAIVLKRAMVNLEVAISESRAVITSDPMPVVSCDPTQMTQLFQNLIANAIKFRGETSPLIHVSAERVKSSRPRASNESGSHYAKGNKASSEDWMFSLRDNGIGIAPEYRERIFGVFQRLHTRDEYPGTGIGLAICKKIIERHGGRIWVESEPDKGSSFYFTIPDGVETLTP